MIQWVETLTFALGFVHTHWECGCHSYMIALSWRSIVFVRPCLSHDDAGMSE